MDPYLGEIRLFAGNFAPKYWAICDGTLLPISQNTALFSLLGTMYGGDGKSTFALPNLQGRVPLAFGQGPGLSSYVQGEQGGEQLVHLQASQMPQHTHSAMGNPNAGSVGTVENAVWAGSGGRGRPSTYAAIISTIQDRKYVEKTEGRLVPTETGKTVNEFLLKGFPDLVNVDFTSQLEEQLDEVEEGNKQWVTAVRDFYLPFTREMERAKTIPFLW